MRKFLFLLLIVSYGTALFAQNKLVSGCGEYNFIQPDNITRDEAKKYAIAKAKDDAFIRVYGENLSSSQVLKTDVKNGTAKTSFSEYTELTRDYEWMEDIKEPVLTYEMDAATGQTRITAKVCGKFRKLGAQTDLTATVLCNGVEKEIFRSGDTVGIQFKAAEDGYLSIFSKEESELTYCWLPYVNEEGKPRQMKRNKNYSLVCQADPLFPLPQIQGPIILVTDHESEEVAVWFVFSTNEYALPTMEYDSENEIYFIRTEDFERWYYKSRNKDPNLQKLERNITIKKK
ncbi:MAG: hypothetical protein IJK85_01135 [Bacteroidales bacterium]|nr:hypothetical protein [Bacteroidales bacterium]